jgi:hypothetical protein
MRRAGIACALAGAAWLALIPGSVFVRDGALSYDGYFRLMSVPLLVYVLAWIALRPLWPSGRRADLGYWITLAGLVLVFGGVSLEFWGAWLTGNTNAYEAYLTGRESWWGSNVGWRMFGLGLLGLFAGGVTAAVAAARARVVPRWGTVLFALLGFGILNGNVLHDARPAVTTLFFGAWGLAWIGFGLALARRAAAPYEPSSRTTS